MLDDDYKTRFGELIQSLSWDIELPVQWNDFFAERGALGTLPEDERRRHQRMRVRVRGALFFLEPLPFLQRTRDPIGIYSREFSRRGLGFLTSQQIFPEEVVRIVLPTFWLDVRIVQTRRFSPKCYLAGAQLVRQYAVSLEAFDKPKRAAQSSFDAEHSASEPHQADRGLITVPASVSPQ